MDAVRTSPINGRISRRILLGSLGANIAGAFLSACSGARSSTATAAIAATPTSARSVETATALPPSTPPPTATPLTIVTLASPAAPAVAELVTWTDSRKFVQLQFPRTWQTSVAERRPANILELRAPDRRAGLYDTLVLWLDVHDPQRGTLDTEIQLIRDELTASTPYVASMQTVTDLTVGAEPGKSFTFTLTPSFNPTIHNGWQKVVVNHAGRAFVIEALRRPDTGATLSAEIDAVIASLRFLP